MDDDGGVRLQVETSKIGLESLTELLQVYWATL